MNIPDKKKRFLKFPRYPGGKEAFRKFIAENLRYPKEALDAKIEGKVLVGYEIDDNGLVHSAHILSGLGHGCDEEAVRVVSLLRFGKVKNRGVRLKVTTKTTINFRLPKYNISYRETDKKKPEPKKEVPVTFEYTINLIQGSKS